MDIFDKQKDCDLEKKENLLMPANLDLPYARLLPDTTTIAEDGTIHIAGHSLVHLAQQYGTPLYIFDRATIVNACQQYWGAFKHLYHASPLRIIYAAKAYITLFDFISITYVPL